MGLRLREMLVETEFVAASFLCGGSPVADLQLPFLSPTSQRKKTSELEINC